MSAQAAVVLTTIHDSDVLEGYEQNFARHGHVEGVRMIVIVDRKTPRGMVERCHRMRKRGCLVECPTLEEQETFLRALGALADLVPYDSDNRRNVGFLMALAGGADQVISIDDDNFCRPETDFIAEHAVVLADAMEHDVVEAENGWFNPCLMLELEPPSRVYPRGFPYSRRGRDTELVTIRRPARVGINAGLWLGAPDLNAMTWLETPVRATAVRHAPVVLGPRTWSPVNTQNTAVRADVMPAYYFIRMGYEVAGLSIDRFGDIFSGYFAQTCMKHLGDHVRFGTPASDSVRNPHDHLLDATREMACVRMVEDLVEWLPEAPVSGSTYPEVYASLAAALDDQVGRFRGEIWQAPAQTYFHEMTGHMRAWLRACERVS